MTSTREIKILDTAETGMSYFSEMHYSYKRIVSVGGRWA